MSAGGFRMDQAKIAEIEERLKHLPPDKLAVVLDFVDYLAGKQESSEAYQTMLASEQTLAKDWDTPQEDEAWAHL
jgi:hypothetical protein